MRLAQWGLRALGTCLVLLSQAHADLDTTPDDVDKSRTWVLGGSGSLVVSRLDPIMAPGRYSGHVHRVLGGSAFTASLTDPEALVKSSCTSLRVKADKSNYWTPSLYFINQNGTYSLMRHGTKVYYFMPQVGDPSKRQKYHAFPPGLRMIVGLGGKREPGAIQVQSLELNMDPYCDWKGEMKPAVCDGFEPVVNNRYLANGTTHPTSPRQEYIHLNIRFPSCGWANQSLDSWDHFSHMTWPVYEAGVWAPAGTFCPESHPIRYPQIFLENFVYFDDRMKAEWNTTGPNLILANGDVTGITYHADFVSGWEPEALQEALDTCGDLGHQLEECAPLKVAPGDPGFVHECRTESKIPTEDVGVLGPLAQLPGCNPRWDWDGPKTKPTDCPWYKGDPGWAAPNLMLTDGPEHQFPVAIPGLDDNKVVGAMLPGAAKGRSVTLARWGLNTRLDGNATNPVQVGTQEEINAAARNPAAVLGGTGFTGIDPGKYRLSEASVQEAKRLARPNSKQIMECKLFPDSPLPCTNQRITENSVSPTTQTPAQASSTLGGATSTVQTPGPPPLTSPSTTPTRPPSSTGRPSSTGWIPPSRVSIPKVPSAPSSAGPSNMPSPINPSSSKATSRPEPTKKVCPFS